MWVTSLANELGHLAQDINNVKGTNTMHFIPHNNVPPRCTITYGCIVVDYRTQKQEPNQTQLTVGGDKIDYPFKKATPMADLTMAKLLFNFTISTHGAKIFGIDIKNFYLNMPLDHFEYMRLPLNLIPAEIIQHYNLHHIQHNGWIYIEIQKGMYGLPQAGMLANKLLTQCLAMRGFYRCQFTPGLWRHAW